jgi:hypothetical protein
MPAGVRRIKAGFAKAWVLGQVNRKPGAGYRVSGIDKRVLDP